MSERKGERIAVQCKVCGKEFVPVKEAHYIGMDKGVTGVSTMFNHTQEQLYDCIDCPECGCQAVLQKRLYLNKTQMELIEKSLGVARNQKLDLLAVKVEKPEGE